MIKIEKDGHSIICSNSTYNTMYKRLGYTIVNENQKVQPVEKNETKQEETVEIPVIETKVEKEIKIKNKRQK